MKASVVSSNRTVLKIKQQQQQQKREFGRIILNCLWAYIKYV